MQVFVNARDHAGEAIDAIERAVRATLRAEGHTEGEISVTLMNDQEIRAMNRDYLERDSITDVIAFGLGDETQPLGDVYLGVEQAARQAQEHSVPLEEELVRLAIHGTLHVLGHEHPEGPERVESPMFLLQERLVRAVLSDS